MSTCTGEDDCQCPDCVAIAQAAERLRDRKTRIAWLERHISLAAMLVRQYRAEEPHGGRRELEAMERIEIYRTEVNRLKGEESDAPTACKHLKINPLATVTPRVATDRGLRMLIRVRCESCAADADVAIDGATLDWRPSAAPNLQPEQARHE